MRKSVGVPLLLVFLFTISAGLSLVIFKDARGVMSTADEALIARFQGAAYEDIFGFGFWPTWGITAVIQIAIAAGSWALLRKSRLRYRVSIPLLVLAFAVASVLEYRAFLLEETLWVMHARP
jgi:hypothetical protein